MWPIYNVLNRKVKNLYKKVAGKFGENLKTP